jgi:acetyl esterase/lipase
MARFHLLLLGAILFASSTVSNVYGQLQVSKDSATTLVGVRVSHNLGGLNLKNLSEKILYKKTAQQDMYLYVLRPVKKANKPLPVIIYFVGGGWVNGAVEYQLPVAAWFRDQGIVAITADYRVKSRHNTTPLECIEDAKSAVRYVRTHASELGIDPNKVIVAGGSAGGHIAACTALKGGDAPGEDLSVSTVPNALVLHNPVVGEGFREDFFKEHPEFSPLIQANKGWPATIVSHGTKDSTVPFSGASKFVTRLKGLGVDAELITVKDAEHSCDWPNSNPNFLPTITAMTQFLVNHDLIEDKNVMLKPIAPDSLYPPSDYAADYVIEWSKTHYKERIKEFKTMPVMTDNIVMLGNSLTEGGKNWGSKLGNHDVINRGISGDVTQGVLMRIGEICFSKPKSIFLLIGINDINGGNKSAEETLANILKIVSKIHTLSPRTKVYVQTILPTNYNKLVPTIATVNKGLKAEATANNYVVIDTHALFADENDLMKPALTSDGVHLTDAGYEVWTKELSKYIKVQ